MVSIHIVPVIVYLIIRVIKLLFRFKRGNCTVTRPTHRGSRIAELFVKECANERIYSEISKKKKAKIQSVFTKRGKTSWKLHLLIFHSSFHISKDGILTFWQNMN